MALGTGFVTGCERGWLQALSPEDPGRRLLLDPAPAASCLLQLDLAKSLDSQSLVLESPSKKVLSSLGCRGNALDNLRAETHCPQ